MTDGIYLLLGSNQGDKRKHINAAIKLINQEAGKILKKSSYYRTGAWGKTDQPEFLNMVIEIESFLNPHDLLKVLLNIETKLGRVRREKWKERLIDIDILYFADQVVDEESLKIPHPEIANRRFTLVPLVEIAADYFHPVLKKCNSLLLDECLDQLSVIKITN